MHQGSVCLYATKSRGSDTILILQVQKCYDDWWKLQNLTWCWIFYGNVSQVFQKLMGSTEPFEPMLTEPLHGTQAVLTHEKNITKNKEWMTLMRAAAVLKCAWRKTRAPDIRFSAEFVSTSSMCALDLRIFRLKRKSIVFIESYSCVEEVS